MATKKYLDGDGVAQVWQATKDYVATHADTRHSAASESILGTPDTAQWAQRESTGSGAATVRSVQGASVVWNQLVKPNPRSVTSKGVTFTNTSDGKVTLDGTATGVESFTSSLAFQVVRGHKYLCIGADTTRAVSWTVNGIGSGLSGESIYTASTDNLNATLQIVTAATYTGTYECYPQLFDLTQMFGSGNEPTTVAEFEAMYPASYYPYSAPTLKPVRISGIRSTDAQGGELDAIEWTAQTLWALEVAPLEANWVQDILTATEVVRKVGVFDIGTLTWTRVVGNPNAYFITTSLDDIALRGCKVQMDKYEAQYEIQTGTTAATDLLDKHYSYITSGTYRDRIVIRDDAYQTADALKASLSGVICTYALVTPTTTPISPALPMTYEVQQGGTESIIVPEGEISAAPIITLAEGESAADVVMDALACIAAPDGPVATSNHAVGTYLTMQGKLYKVTSAIAVGETIVAGTNVSETTVMSELLARTA